jgi:hypothetical protein
MSVKSIISAYYSAMYAHNKKSPLVSRQEVTTSFYSKHTHMIKIPCLTTGILSGTCSLNYNK